MSGQQARSRAAQNKEWGAPKSTEPQASLTADQAAAEVARYIAQLTGELTDMARAAGLDSLGYFLSMARVEAEMAARRG